MIGFPGETENDLNLTKKMIFNLTKKGIDEIAIFIITPIPGSEIFNQLKGYTSLSELNFSPSWRSDYNYLFRKRIYFYLYFIFFKTIFFPLKILRQIINFFLKKFETKMELFNFV